MEKELQFCTFRIASSLFGVKIQFVKEIIPEFYITQVPHATKIISGLVNIRGEIYLAYNLRTCLGFDHKSKDENSRIILFKNIDAEPSGVLVDSIADVVNVSSRQIVQYHPDHRIDTISQEGAEAAENDAELIEGVIPLAKEVLIILNVTALLHLK